MRARASDGRGGEREVRFEVGEEEIREREAVEYGGGGGEVLVLHGEMDETIPVEDAWEVGRVTGGQVVDVKEAGHGLWGWWRGSGRWWWGFATGEGGMGRGE